MHPLISEYLTASLSLKLEDVTLKNPQKTILTEGTGVIVFCDGELQATVTGKSDDPPVFIVGEGHNASFSASVADKGCIATAVFNGSTRSYDMDLDQQVWRGALQRIRIDMSTPEPSKSFRFIGVLVSFPKLTFGMSRKKSPHCAIFGDSEPYQQYLELEVGNYTIALRKRGAFAEVAALLQPNTSIEDVKLLQDALKNAISVRWGFDVTWLAVSIKTYDAESISIFPWAEILRGSHLGSTAPLVVGPFEDGTNERLLTLGLEFFLQNDRVALEEYLNLFWHSAASLSIPVRESCLGAAIEGIAQEIIEKGTSNLVLEIQQAKQRFRDCKIKLLDHIKSAPEVILQDSTFTILQNALNQAEFFRAKEMLAKAAQAIGFTLSPGELKSWGDMRNDAAHGKNPIKKHDEKRYRDYYTCIGILNKFALALIKYEGKIDDFSNLEHKIEDFKLWQ